MFSGHCWPKMPPLQKVPPGASALIVPPRYATAKIPMKGKEIARLLDYTDPIGYRRHSTVRSNQ